MNRLETKTEDIFGIVDDALDSIERHRPTKRRVVSKKTRPTVMPKMKVRRSEVPEGLNKVEAANVVYVPDSVLHSLTATLNVETKKLNSLLLQKLMPMLLSYQTSTRYASAAVKEGLDVDLDFDPGLLDCVHHIGYLNVVTHFIKQSRLPIEIKKRFMRRFSDLLAEQAVSAMTTSNAAQAKKTQFQELQAVVYSRQKNKTEVKTNEPEKIAKSMPAVRKSRV